MLDPSGVANQIVRTQRVSTEYRVPAVQNFTAPLHWYGTAPASIIEYELGMYVWYI